MLVRTIPRQILLYGQAGSDQECSNGVPGFENIGGDVCCNLACSQCGGAGCGDGDAAEGAGRFDCCVGPILFTGNYCDDIVAAPCILGGMFSFIPGTCWFMAPL